MGKNAVSRWKSRLWRHTLCVACWSLGAAVLAPEAVGLTPLRFESAEERVLGFIGLAACCRGSEEKPSERQIVLEAGEFRLFEIKGLRADGFRITIEGMSSKLSFSGAALFSPVGSEKSAGLDLQLQTPGRAVLGAGLHGSLADIPPLLRATLVTIKGFLLTELLEDFLVGCAVEDLRLHGEALPGADMSLWITVRATGFFTAVSTLRADRWGTVSVAFAASLCMSRYFRGSLGYDDASNHFKTSATLTSGSFECEVGVLLHPVLGVSKGIFLRWRR